MPPNINWGQLLSTTLINYQPTLFDNIFMSSPLLFHLRKTQKLQTGGESILVRLEYGENPNVLFYSGMQLLAMDTGEEITSVQFNWKNLAGSVVMAGDEMRKNAGKHRMINLLESKIQNCENTIIKKLNAVLYGDGTSYNGKAFLGLTAIVSDTGTLAGIDRSVHSWWQANVVNSSSRTWGGSSDTAHLVMRNMYNRCSKGTKRESPNLIVTTQDLYELYEGSLAPNLRYTNVELADAGFIAIEFKKTPMVWDQECVAKEMLFLNTNYVFLIMDTQANFTPTPWQSPYNQDGIGNHILTTGNLIVNQSRKLGKLTNLS